MYVCRGEEEGLISLLFFRSFYVIIMDWFALAGICYIFSLHPSLLLRTFTAKEIHFDEEFSPGRLAEQEEFIAQVRQPNILIKH